MIYGCISVEEEVVNVVDLNLSRIGDNSSEFVCCGSHDNSISRTSGIHELPSAQKASVRNGPGTGVHGQHAF